MPGIQIFYVLCYKWNIIFIVLPICIIMWKCNWLLFILVVWGFSIHVLSGVFWWTEVFKFWNPIYHFFKFCVLLAWDIFILIASTDYYISNKIIMVFYRSCTTRGQVLCQLFCVQHIIQSSPKLKWGGCYTPYIGEDVRSLSRVAELAQGWKLVSVRMCTQNPGSSIRA